MSGRLLAFPSTLRSSPSLPLADKLQILALEDRQAADALHAYLDRLVAPAERRLSFTAKLRLVLLGDPRAAAAFEQFVDCLLASPHETTRPA